MTAIGYYVTARRDSRTGWLFGPIADHGVALMMVPFIRMIACNFDPFMHFDAFGTSSITRPDGDTRPLPIGQMNHLVGRKEYLSWTTK